MRNKSKHVNHKATIKKELKVVKSGYSKFILPAILLLTVVAFSPSIHNGFSNWDDNKYILDNPYIRNLSWQNIKTIFTTEYFNLYIPVTTFSWAMQYFFFGLNPKSFHAIDLLFHLLNTGLVFYFIKSISNRIGVATIVAVFFGIHPMHVESVAWIAERKDVLYAFFYLAALISYVKYIDYRFKKYSIYYSTQFYFITLLFFVFSLLSKPTAISLPVLFFAIDYYFDRKLVSYKTVFEKIPFFILSAIVGIAIIFSSDKAQLHAPHYSAFDRVFLPTYSFAFYVIKAFLPFQLSAFYAYPVFKENNSILPTIYYFSPLIILLPTALIYNAGKYKRDIVFGLSFFTITIFMFLQVVLAGAAIVADRYTYIPYIGLFFIIGTIIEDKLVDSNSRVSSWYKIWLIGSLTVVILFFSAITFNRNKIWENGITVFSDMLENNSTLSFAYNSRGLAKDEFKDTNGAIVDFTNAILYDNKNASAYINRANARVKMNDINGAMADYNKAIELNPVGDNIAFNNRGRAKAGLGDYQGALVDFNQAIFLEPNYADAYNNRGNIKAIMNDNLGAMKDYETAIKLNPDYSDAVINLNSIKNEMGSKNIGNK